MTGDLARGDNTIRIDFWIEGKQPFALRYSIHVPCVGDAVRFDGIVYRVVNRIWIYDERASRVLLGITKIKEGK